MYKRQILAGLSAAVLLIGSLVGRFPIRAGNLLAMTVILWLYCLFVSLITLLAGNMSGSSWLGLSLIHISEPTRPY